jgi:glycerol-3-phosphate dehydrogenase
MRRDLQALGDGTFDVLVLGGGITGAGVALDAVLRGLRVALIDKGDFASGTSSISSKLVHGGLRYLEHGDFRLVYEALHERRRLLRNAPHLVHPLRFVVPFLAGARVPPWKWRVGLVLYDLLAGAGNLRRSRPRSAASLHREFPGLRAAGLSGGAEFFDAQMDDARLCLAVLQSAARHGAVIANYVEAVGFEHAGGVLGGVRARDHLTGGELTVRARQVVNATGPWGDAVRRLAGDGGAPRLRPTKGVHLVAPGRGLPAAFLLLHPDDGRVFFVMPWMNKTLIGTTDTEADATPDDARVTAGDAEYLLRGHNYYFSPELSGADVLGLFAGLRPLLGTRPGGPSERTREFRVDTSPTGLLSVAGGKYTTYRHMAEVVTDAVVRRLGLRRRCRTRGFRLDGAPTGDGGAFAAAATTSLERSFALDGESARHLVGRYGTRAADVAGYLRRDPGLARRVVPGEPELLAEFAYQRDQEMAVRPADFLLRRTRLGLFHPELLAAPLPNIALAPLLEDRCGQSGGPSATAAPSRRR